MKIIKPRSIFGLPGWIIRVTIVIILAGSFVTLTLGVLGQNKAQAKTNQGYEMVSSSPPAATSLALNVGDVITRVQCTQGYTAYLYNDNVTTADGLAIYDDKLYVAEESADQVSQVGVNNVITPVLQNINQPEGITFDDDGNLYAVEDIEDGRIIKRDTSGVTSTIASGLNSPEGIVWVDDGSDDGILYVTESNIGETASISDVDASYFDIDIFGGTATVKEEKFQTHVTSVSLDGQVTKILTRSAVFTPASFTFFPIPDDSAEGQFWSYTGEIVLGSDGLLYLSNELSEQVFTDTVSIGSPLNITLAITATSGDSIFTFNPTISTTETSFTAGLESPEGLQFSQDGDFPLYVAEEGPLDQSDGRISLVAADGSYTTLCTGFGNIEDMVIDDQGQIYVSEDRASNTDTTSSIILLRATTVITYNNHFFPIILKEAVTD